MRIEIFADGTGTVSQLQGGLSTLQSSICATIESLRAVNQKMSNLSGGLGNLSSAYQNVQSRIFKEESRLTSVERVLRTSTTFLNNVVSTDSRVAKLVNQNQEKFFETHHWLRPVVVEEKSWWEQRVEDWNNFWSTAGEVLKSTLDGILSWVKEHAVEIIIGAVAIVVGAVLTALTGGAFLAALVVGLKAAAISAMISGAINASVAVLSGGDILESFGDGLASGFMFGGLFSGISMIASSGIRLALAKSPRFASKLLSNGKISEFVLKRIVPAGAKNTFVSSANIADGYKYNLQMNRIFGKSSVLEIKWHSPDIRWIGDALSNSGQGWTAQIKIGSKYLTTLGNLVRNNRQNITHIPIIKLKWWQI